jgi:DNA processing protein
VDLQTVVAASMLPASRSLVSSAFVELREGNGRGVAFLELLWAAAGRREVLGSVAFEALLETAALAMARARDLSLVAIPYGDSRYPPLLARIHDPPPILWARGQHDVLAMPTVAIVGSRAATTYALQVGARLAGELAERGVVVASGLARGVDSSAHRGCLDAGGRTLAVLGCGLDRVYPAEHEDLAERIAETGLILAELAPGAPPLPEHFPLRNRIISGISLATVVVEASDKSGSLITARCALDQGREVMAVPGSVLSGRNRGSHALLKDGAKVVESADDILAELGWTPVSDGGVASNTLNADPLLAVMDPGTPYLLEELAARAGLSAQTVLARLTTLELEGRIAATTGRFLRPK